MSGAYIDKLAWIHIKDGRLLCARSYGKDAYYIPGGKRDGEETDHQALIREIEEELTVRLVPESLRLLGQFEAQAHGKPEGTMVRMTCYTGGYAEAAEAATSTEEAPIKGTQDASVQGARVLQPSSEIEELAWLKHEDRHRTSAVVVIVMDWLKSKSMIE